MMASLGFIGMGIMGSRMAANLVRAGLDVTVWNLDADACAPLVALGAKQATSPKALVQACDITFAMVSDPAAARDVAFADEGVLSGITTGKAYIDMSTVDAGCAQEIAAAVIAAGGRFLEAPVSGSKKPAEDGTLVILAAGDRSLYDEAIPAFEKMGKMHVYLGEVGNGANMKLVVNMVMGSMMSAFSEGIALAQKSGLDAGTLLEVLDNGAIANPMFKIKGPNVLNGEFGVHFPLKHMQKDMRLALLLGDEVLQAMPVAAAANECFKQAKELGHADNDMSAVFNAIKKN